MPRIDELHTPEEVLRLHSSGPKTGVFTDGSCEGNPGPGGWGFVHVESDEIIEERYGADPATTNNRMELRALIEAYKALPRKANLTIYSDSQLDLVKELYALAGEHPDVRLEWIRAHDGSKWNEYADALATTYLRESR
jgi:ribonuclease HI